jgi:hypothetical protein
MPFSSLADPVEVARAHAAFAAAWERLTEKELAVVANPGARDRLAYIVTHLVTICNDENEIVDRALTRFSEGAQR